MVDQHEKYMRRALELATLGRLYASPNPMVGCVIVQKDLIIGEGWHQQYGGPHAEVNAVNSVADAADILGSTVYVTLEPCAHQGKTPPCAELLSSLEPDRVVIATTDSNPKVSGKGISILEDAGIEVIIGVLSDHARRLNRRFFTAFEKNRPYVILKWAQTSDGFIARENYDSKWISNASSRKLVHKWRAEEDAILVGYNTAQHDNPSLTTRDWEGKNPIRIVIDPNMELANDGNLFDQTTPTYRIVKDQEPQDGTIALPEITPHLILEALVQKDIHSIIIEGGSKTLQQFIDAELWDEARVFVSDVEFGKGISAPRLNRLPNKIEKVFGDQLHYYYA
ncbi:MAG: bifunctional diaminohydroxyphosphoribosylaminopyrimidine deaminase/5-amino-6-(5-phosphoribosylamino)uracil reductase RibD [Cyclobacteriaceae bacterium]